MERFKALPNVTTALPGVAYSHSLHPMWETVVSPIFQEQTPRPQAVMSSSGGAGIQTWKADSRSRSWPLACGPTCVIPHPQSWTALLLTS